VAKIEAAWGNLMTTLGYELVSEGNAIANQSEEGRHEKLRSS